MKLFKRFDFGYQRLEVLDITASLITDIDFDFLILREFTFTAERQKAFDILAVLRPPDGLTDSIEVHRGVAESKSGGDGDDGGVHGATAASTAEQDDDPDAYVRV